jgi:hypothetical protein
MRRILATLTVVGALLFSAGSARADWDDGAAAYKRGDYATALKELRPLAEQGDAKAQFGLGFMYAEGQGVPEISAEAVKWWRKAAEQGHADAQFNLALMYANGEGVPVNNIKAYMWFSLAKAQGDKDKKAAGNLDIVKKRMNTAQIAKAQELAAFSSASQSAQNLVEDLRSGKSDVRAAISTGNFTGVIKFWREMKSKPDFKVTVSNQGWSHGAYSAHSAEARLKRPLKTVRKRVVAGQNVKFMQSATP